MIEVNHLTKRYGELTAIQDVSFQMKQGEVVGFLGVNGAGKTTTMRILTGYMPPTGGQATVAGYDILTQSLDARRRIGYLPETVPLYTEMRVVDYIDYMARLRGLRHGRDRRVRQVLDMVNIGRLDERLIGTLSKGQRQRVGLAQAIVHNPDVLVLDEPTIGLDPRQIREVRAVIRQLGEAHTILLSTHILPEVEQVCSRVLIVSAGRIRADMPISEATTSGPPERVLVRLGGAAADQALAALRGLNGVADVRATGDGAYEVVRAADMPALDLRPAIAQLIVGRGWQLLDLRASGTGLEDLFLRVTSEDAALAAAALDEPEETDEEYDEDEEDETDETDESDEDEEGEDEDDDDDF
jgi:ABC-2 type transport system ATP-binding protein